MATSIRVPPPGCDGLTAHPHAARWTALIAAAIRSEEDPRTLSDWARLANVSASALRASCYLAHTSPRNSLALARILRASLIAAREGCEAADLLDIRDPRTLQRLLQHGGVPQRGRVTDAAIILDSQVLVTAQDALRLLRQWLNRTTAA